LGKQYLPEWLLFTSATQQILVSDFEVRLRVTTAIYTVHEFLLSGLEVADDAIYIRRY